MATALIGLGANLGDRAAALDAALSQLAQHAAIDLIGRSPAQEFAGVGGPLGQPAYLNAAALLETALSPHALWSVMAEVETSLGRTREVRWGPRSIDLDLLLYDGLVLHSPALVVPHPRLAVRRFVLQPAAQIAGEMLHPTIGWTIARLLAHLNEHPRYVALAGPLGVGKTQVARDVIAELRGPFGIPARSIEEPIDDAMLTRFYEDPAGRAAETELEFLSLRAPLVAGLDRREQADWMVSDFWFDQALAYGELWLSPADRELQRQHYEALGAAVTPPKLLVLLDAPSDELRRRIAHRGRPYEQTLSVGLLDQLRQNIRCTAASAFSGPVLHLSALQKDAVITEVTSAIVGMQ